MTTEAMAVKSPNKTNIFTWIFSSLIDFWKIKEKEKKKARVSSNSQANGVVASAGDINVLTTLAESK